MDSLRDEWIKLLEKQNFPEWKISLVAGDIIIKIPDSQDIRLVDQNFPDTIALLRPEIESIPRRVRFIIHNRTQRFQYELG